MTDLDTLISEAYSSSGEQDKVNKVYLAFLKTILYMPVIIPSVAQENEDPFTPLYLKENDDYFVCIFDTLERLQKWANDENMDYVELSGLEIISGINPKVFLCLNVGYDFFKQFSPDEILHLKKIVSKIQNLKQN